MWSGESEGVRRNERGGKSGVDEWKWMGKEVEGVISRNGSICGKAAAKEQTAGARFLPENVYICMLWEYLKMA